MWRGDVKNTQRAPPNAVHAAGVRHATTDERATVGADKQ